LNKAFNFINLSPEFSKEWDKIIQDSDDAWLYHLYDWLHMTENVWDLISKSFLVEHNKEIIAIFPLQMHKKNRILKSVFMGPGGPAIKNSIDLNFRNRVLQAMYSHVKKIALKSRSPYIEIYLPPLINSSISNFWGVNPLINYSYIDISTHTWIVDLRKPEEIIYQNLSYDARRNIKKATKTGFSIRNCQSINEVDKYYKVHTETYNRTGAHPHPKEYFYGIYKYICDKGFGVIWEALDKENNPIAFKITGIFKKSAVYWAGCCKTKYLDSGVNYLLQYNAMLWAKQQGAEWFDNGEAFPNINEGKLRGLTIFKSKFGGELHRLFKGKLNLMKVSEIIGILGITKHFIQELFHSIKSHVRS
jgi:hypothetical protein